MKKRGWSQRDLASHLGIAQRHISGIESGKIVPRYDTLLEMVRMLDHDLIMVPRALVPVVQSLVRDHHKDQAGEGEERSLYAADRDDDTRRSRAMKFDPKKLNALSVRLYGKQIGVINRLAGDRQLFAFEQDYIDDPQRPTLSLSFKGSTGGLVTNFRPVGRRVPVFFSNLLPEGHLRDYLAKRADVNPEREFFLLAVLGADLPGALIVAPLEGHEQPSGPHHGHDDDSTRTIGGGEEPLRFSLAGVQLKFSAVMEASGGLTIPAAAWADHGSSSCLPPASVAVPENEFAMLELARRVGITVPENKLVDIASIKGLPEQAHTVGRQGARREAVRSPVRTGNPFTWRISRKSSGNFPNNKYKFRSYANIAAVLWAEIGEDAVIGIRPAARVLRRHRQCRHAPQELVPSLSRPAHARALAGLRFCRNASVYSRRHAGLEFRRQPQPFRNHSRPDAPLC